MYGRSLLLLAVLSAISIVLCSCGPFGIIPLAGVAAGGGGGSDSSDDPPPGVEVISITPADGATNVSINANIIVTFSEPVNAASVNSTNFDVDNHMPGTFYFSNGNNTVTFVPSSSYPMISTVTVRLTNIESKNEPGKMVNFRSSFTTGGADTSHPVVDICIPVDSIEIPYQQYIPATVIFSKPMNTGTVTSSSFYIYEVGSGTSLNGNITWTANQKAFTFTPTDSMSAGEGYDIRVINTVEDTGGYQMLSAFTSNFVLVDLNPTAIIIPSGANNPVNYINSITENNVTVRVGLNSNVQTTDIVWIGLTDGANYVYQDKYAQVTGPFNLEFTNIDTSSLNNGSITLEAGIIRNDYQSEVVNGSATKDTSAPTVSVTYPSQIPAYYEPRTLEMSLNFDQDCTLHMTGGFNNVSTAYSAGTYDVDYDLRLADKNDINIHITDVAGNKSNEINQTVYQRGSAGGGPLSGSSMTVMVYSSSSLTPVSGAMVIRGYASEIVYTNPEGIATFENVTGPQAITVVQAGCPIISILDMNATRLSVPLLDEITGSGEYASLSGNVLPSPSSGMLYASNIIEYEGQDIDITDGFYDIHVKPNRTCTVSAIDMSAGFNNFAMKSNLGPYASMSVNIEDLNFPGVAPTVVQNPTGTVEIPDDFYPRDQITWSQGACVVLSRSRAEGGRFFCGLGTPPNNLYPGSGPQDYSLVQPGYYQTPTGEYWMLLKLNDMRGRVMTCSKMFPPGNPYPNFVPPDVTKLIKPGLGGIVTTQTPTFEWSDGNTNGIHVVTIINKENDNMWIVVNKAGKFNATLPHIPAYAPVQVMQFNNPTAKLEWRIESSYHSSTLDYSDFTFIEQELGTEYRMESEWREFTLWNPPDTNGVIPGFGMAGEPTGTLTVTVVDQDTDAPVPNATVYLGDSPAGAQLTNSSGQIVFNSVPVPTKITVCMFGYPYMTFDGLEASYATLPLFSSMDGGNEFTLYGEIWGLPTGNEGHVRASHYYNENFQVHNSSGDGLSDPHGNTPYDGGVGPENYSIQAEGRDEYMVVTGIYGPGTASKLFDYAYFSDPFLVNPYDYGSYTYQQAPDMYYGSSSSSSKTPIRYVTNASDIYLPSNLMTGWSIDHEPWCDTRGLSTDNLYGDPVIVYLGESNVYPDLLVPEIYHYGFSFAAPPNFTLDWMMLEFGVEGDHPDGTKWKSGDSLHSLESYPAKYNVLMDDIPYPVSPILGDTGVGVTPTLSWENTLDGREGIYMITILRDWAPRPFYWMLIVPALTSGPVASFTLPQLPGGFFGPESGEIQGYEINANRIDGLHISSWDGDVFDIYGNSEASWREGYFTP